MRKPKISFEFFPPRSEVQQRKFWTTLGCLQTLNPKYLSMTWGALGTSWQASLDILEPLITDAKVPVAAHLTCVGHTERSIRQTIQSLEAIGVRRFVALRGDMPDAPVGDDSLRYASELVAILAEDSSRDISVAAYPETHPEAHHSRDDIKWLKQKLDAGASRAITQFFFSAETFLRFRDAAVAQGITQDLVPGILPIHNIAKVQEFSAQCGASIPPALVKRFTKASNAQSAQDLAVDHAVQLIDTLHREGVESFHLYTLNQAELSYRICKALGNVKAKDDVHAAA